MMITSKVSIDLMEKNRLETVNAVQDDRYFRNLELSLYTVGVHWEIPEKVAVLIRYCKADGNGDELPDGTTAWGVD